MTATEQVEWPPDPDQMPLLEVDDDGPRLVDVDEQLNRWNCWTTDGRP